MTLGERITEARKSMKNKTSQTELAEMIGMKRSAYSLYEIDRVTPTVPILMTIANATGVSLAWLKDEIGPMRVDLSYDDKVMAILAGENEFAKSVLRAFAHLEDEDWARLRQFVDLIKK